MTTPIGSPDWIKPLPGGAKLLINATFDWSTGVYDSGWIDCSAFNGLFLTCSALGGNAAQFGTINVSFQDQSGAAVQSPIYPIVYRGDLRIQVNIPVLGAQFKVRITGPGVAASPSISVTGHGGGGSASFRPPVWRRIGVDGAVLGVNGFTTVTIPIITEGPATLSMSSAGQPGWVGITGYDSAGASQFFDQFQIVAGGSETRTVYIPPCPIVFQVTNTGTAGGNFWGGLVLGRT